MFQDYKRGRSGNDCSNHRIISGYVKLVSKRNMNFLKANQSLDQAESIVSVLPTIWSTLLLQVVDLIQE
jgi:hypothetical protein